MMEVLPCGRILRLLIIRSGSSCREMDQLANNKADWPSLLDDSMMARPSTWLRSLSQRSCRLPKLPGTYLHQSGHSKQQAVHTNDKLSRIVLPPLSGTATASSWLLPTVQRKELYRPCPAVRDQAMGSKSSTPAESLSAGKVGRLPPLTTAPTVPFPGEEEDEEEEEETIVMALGAKSDADEPAAVAHIGEEEVLHYLDDDDVFLLQEEEVAVGRQEGAEAALSGHGCPAEGLHESFASVSRDGSLDSPARTPLQWAVDWTVQKDSLLLQSSSQQRKEQQQESPSADEDDVIDMTSTYEFRPWPSSSAGRVRHSPPPSPTMMQLPPAGARAAGSSSLVMNRARSAHPSISMDYSTVDDQVIEDIDHILDDMELVSADEADHHDSSTTLYRLEKNVDGSEVVGYNLPVYGIKPPVLDDDQYGVSMEQLKKLLRPAVNNNEEDHESKETPSASSPAYRRSMPEKGAVVADYVIPNAVHDTSPMKEKKPKSSYVSSKELIVTNGSVAKEAYIDADERPLNINRHREDDWEEELMRIGGLKSQSFNSFPANTYSSSPPDQPDDSMSATRQRSLPARRNESARMDSKLSSSETRFGSNNSNSRKTSVMPSSIMNRRSPGGTQANSSTVSSVGAGPNRTSGSSRSSNSYLGLASLSSTKLSSTAVPVDFQHAQDPRSRLQGALKNINSADWEDKVEGIRRLDELVATNGESVSGEVHTVALALLVEVKNLRSQVSRVAIQSMGNLFQHCGKHMDQDLERAVRLLLNKSGDTNRFIRDDAHTALLAVTQYVSPPKAIAAITAEGLSHKNAVVRAEAAKLLAAIVERLGPARSLSGAKDVTEKILPAAAHFIQDGSLEARSQAKRMFTVLMADPVFDRAVQKYLSPSVIRNIQRTLDQLRKGM